MFLSVYDEVMSIIFNVFTNATSKEFKHLRGNAIECATIIGKVCGREWFAKYQHQLITEMIKIQTNDITISETDP